MYHNDKKGRMHMLELIKITKKFGDFYALKDVNLKVGDGEVHTLLGETVPEKYTYEYSLRIIPADIRRNNL